MNPRDVTQPMTTDDRGQRCAMASIDDAVLGECDPVLAKRLYAAEYGVLRGVLLVVFGVAGGVLALRAIGYTSLWVVIPYSIVASLIITVVAAWVWRRSRGRNEGITNVWRAAGRCGACGYPIMASPVEPDGCRVCPECGAAWKVESGPRATDVGPR